jgi:hypothetical protein
LSIDKHEIMRVCVEVWDLFGWVFTHSDRIFHDPSLFFYFSTYIYLFQANRGGGMSTSIFNKLKDILMLPTRFLFVLYKTKRNLFMRTIAWIESSTTWEKLKTTLSYLFFSHTVFFNLFMKSKLMIHKNWQSNCFSFYLEAFL